MSYLGLQNIQELFGYKLVENYSVILAVDEIYC